MKRSTALIVDDVLSVRTALKRLFVTEGYDVLTAADGAVALRLLESFRVDVILLDIIMPVMDGQTFRDRQLADPRIADIPVVLISESPNASELAKSMGVEHAPKSDPDALVRRVARACQARVHGRCEWRDP